MSGRYFIWSLIRRAAPATMAVGDRKEPKSNTFVSLRQTFALAADARPPPAVRAGAHFRPRWLGVWRSEAWPGDGSGRFCFVRSHLADGFWLKPPDEKTHGKGGNP